MVQVFVSYSRSNQAQANVLAALFKRRGISVFIDSESLVLGSLWQRKLSEGIANSDAVVVLWGPAATESDMVCWEAEQALNQGKYVPLIIEACTIPKQFAHIHALQVDVSRNNSALVDDVLRFAVDEWISRLQSKPTSPASAVYTRHSVEPRIRCLVMEGKDSTIGRDYTYWWDLNFGTMTCDLIVADYALGFLGLRTRKLVVESGTFKTFGNDVLVFGKTSWGGKLVGIDCLIESRNTKLFASFYDPLCGLVHMRKPAEVYVPDTGSYAG